MVAVNYAAQLGSVKPWVRDNAVYLATKYQLTSIGGWRAFGSVPNSDHPKGLAVDYMCSIPVGERIVADVLAHWNDYNVSYVIHNRRIWYSPTRSQVYVGPSPHTDHVHVSYLATPKNQNPVGIVPSIPINPTIPLNPFAQFEFLSDSGLWIRVGLAAAGGILLIMGLWALMGQNVVTIPRKVASYAR